MKVGISLKTLYESGVRYLSYGSEIVHTEDNGNDYYDLYKEGMTNLLLCDGEVVDIEKKYNISTGQPFWLGVSEHGTGIYLTNEEYKIAVFGSVYDLRSENKNMIMIESIIYCDALTMLLNKIDILANVKFNMYEGDFELDQIQDELDEDLIEKFNNTRIDDLVKYMKVNTKDIKFDYAESAECVDLGCVAFRIPIEFDCDKFANE